MKKILTIALVCALFTGCSAKNADNSSPTAESSISSAETASETKEEVIYDDIDYKSDDASYITDDKVFEQTLKEKYENQLNGYEKTIKDLGINNGVIKKEIIYFRNYDRNSKKVDLKVYEL